MDLSLSKMDTKWVAGLTLAGGLPFMVSALMSSQSARLFGIGGLDIAISYGAVIASFLCGLHWGLVLGGRARATWLLILSNLICLLAWSGPLLALKGLSEIALVVEAVAFASLLAIDVELTRRGWLPTAFLRLRIAITAIVILCLGLVFLFVRMGMSGT